MIRSWRLFNFKSFREDTTVPLGPLTVLAGANSSGKSTLLQSMLMVAQTLGSRVRTRPVVLNGPLVRLGTFDSVRSYGSESPSVIVGFVLFASAEHEFVEAETACDFGFDAGTGQSELGQLHPRLTTVEIYRRDEMEGEIGAAIFPAKESVEMRARSIGVKRVRSDHYSDMLYGLVVEERGRPSVEDAAEYIAPKLDHFLPQSGIVSEEIDGLGRRKVLVDRPVPTLLGEAIEHIRVAIGGLRYIGPLREEPRALYPLSTTADTTDVGLRGEHTAAVYDLHRQSLVRYVPTANFPTPAPNAPPLSQEQRTRTLESAVVEWLQYLGVVDSLSTRDLGNLGHELKVTTPGVTTAHDLTHVGTGVSQVLPIVVMCLLAAPDTTILIEQPELHLHPRVQTLLGDFFLAATMAGRQVIVETHSEYLVNRLRYRVASSEGDRVAQLVKTWFVEKDAKGASVFRAVDVNRYGAIAEWPKGFFDQSQREIENILLAGSLKKKAERAAGGR
jgi:predicted ATPase